MRPTRLLLLLTLSVLFALAGATSAAAHPLGNLTVSRAHELRLQPGALALTSLVDMAEIPALQAIRAQDSDGDGRLGPAEAAAYHPAACATLGAGLRLSAAGEPLALAAVRSAVSFPPGAGGLSTLRLECEFAADLPALGAGLAVEFADTNQPAQLGWREIVVGGVGLTITGDVATTSLSGGLRAYPDDLLSAPLDQRSVRFLVAPGAGAAAAAPAAGSPAAAALAGDDLSRLVTAGLAAPGGLLAALLLACGLGAAHALTPGHGKTIVAAYMVGARGTARHAVFLGLTTTVTHTLGVFGLGLVTLLLAEFVLPAQLYPWLGVASGGLVLLIGLALLRARLAPLRGPAGPSHAGPTDQPHDHGFGMHSHASAAAPTWRGLLAVGVSGGLLPCPSALIMLLAAVALGQAGLGLLLVLAFSVGLAGVLTAIGMLLVYARRLFERLPAGGLALRALPLLSAAAVTVAGAGITLRALAEAGVL